MPGLTTRQLPKKKIGFKSSQAGTLQPGDVLEDRYRIIGTLGMGGFSSVYQARDMRFPNVTKLCAVKEMVNLAPDPKVRELANQAFEREANILATLDHPAVVDVYDYFSVAERNYLVLEFIRGKDMESFLDDVTEPVTETQALDWALQVCDVLAYLHEYQPEPIIFRDVKPSNIMLDPHGRVRLIDFGIAKLFQPEEKNTTIGTEGYAPPEQYRGEASPAGDVYGLGATLHHLLTRQDPRLEPPFSFSERPIRAANPAVSPGLEQIIMRCLAYQADDRYPNAVALRSALAEQQGDKTGTVRAAAPQHAPAPATGSGRPVPATRAADIAGEDGDITPIWTFKCEDEIRSMPAVADGAVYVGVYDNNVYALEAGNGAFRWKFPASDGIASSPSVYKNAVYIGSADGSLYSINRRSGRSNWRFQAEGPIYSSPRAQFDHVFFGSDDNHLYAVNTRNGRMAWKANAYYPVRSSPLVTDNHVLFGTEGGYLNCVDLAGETKWHFQAKRAITSTPTLADDIVFVGSVDSTVYALDLASGWAIWRFRANRPIVSSPVAQDGVVYIGSADGNLYAIDAGTGRLRWKYKTEGQIASSPALWNGAVYFGSTDSYVYSLDVNRGRLRWRYRTGGMVISSPSIYNSTVYIGSVDHHLYALPA